MKSITGSSPVSDAIPWVLQLEGKDQIVDWNTITLVGDLPIDSTG